MYIPMYPPTKARCRTFLSPQIFPHMVQSISIISSRQLLSDFYHYRLVFASSWPSDKWNYILCFCVWLLKLNIIFLRFIYVAVFLSVVSFWYQNLSIHSPVDRHCFFLGLCCYEPGWYNYTNLFFFELVFSLLLDKKRNKEWNYWVLGYIYIYIHTYMYIYIYIYIYEKLSNSFPKL